jgi:hypothetical protein
MRTVIKWMVLVLVIIAGVGQASDVRTWTDREGRQFEGEFVGFANGQVQVKRASDGQTFDLPLERFSDADQQFVKSRIAAVGGLTLTGRIAGDPKPVGLIAFNDPASDPSDYDAVGWPTRLKPDGTFRLPIADLLPGAYELRLRVYSENGQAKRFAYSYQVDSFGRPDVSALKVGED